MSAELIENLRAARQAAGLTQRQVGALVPHFHPQTLAKIETGARGVSFEEGMLLASIYGVPPDHLVGNEWVRDVTRASVQVSMEAGLDHAIQLLKQAKAALNEPPSS